MEKFDSQEEHTVKLWLGRLAGVPTVLDIPSDNLRPLHHEPSSRSLYLELPAEAAMLLRDRSQTLNTPSLSILLAAFGLTVSRLIGRSTILVGVASVGNPVPVRLDVNEDLTPRAFVHNVHESLTWSLARRDVPFDTIAARLGVERSGRRHPLVQVFFGVRDPGNPHEIDSEPAAAQIEEVAVGKPEFDIAIHLDNSGQSASGYAVCETGLWDDGEMERFTTNYSAAVVELLESMAEDNSGTTLEGIRCISAKSRK